MTVPKNTINWYKNGVYCNFRYMSGWSIADYRVKYYIAYSLQNNEQVADWDFEHKHTPS